MPKWNIEQRAEVWYSIEVEADTFEEAINRTNEAKSWEFTRNAETTHFTDNYWGENLDTEEQFTQYEGLIRQEN